LILDFEILSCEILSLNYVLIAHGRYGVKMMSSKVGDSFDGQNQGCRI